jgi:RNA polymerase sigma-70 factor (ECF subfamily)
MVNRLAFRLLGSDVDLDDVVQESVTQALDSLHRLGSPDAFKPWLTSLVVRTCHMLLRRRRFLSRLGLRTPTVEVDQVVSRAAPPDIGLELRELYAALDAMPAEQRVALVLRRVEGLSIDEVAQVTGVSNATVKRRIASAEAHLGAQGEPRG